MSRFASRFGDSYRGGRSVLPLPGVEGRPGAEGRPRAAPRLIPQALGQFAEGLLVLVLMAGVLVGFGWLWTWWAVYLLSAGVVIGAMSAMFGAMLETLVHAGKLLIDPLHWLVERLMKHKTVIVVALTILCVPLVGHAADCSYKVTVTPPLSKDWTVEWGDFGEHDLNEPPDPGRSAASLRPNRRCGKSGVSITVQLADEPTAPTMTVEGEDTGGGAALISPMRSARGIFRSVGQFLGCHDFSWRNRRDLLEPP